IDAAKKELARYETEIQPKVEAAEKKRQADEAASGAAVKNYEQTKLVAAQAKFEETIPADRLATEWQPIEIAHLNSTGNVALTKQPDGSSKAGTQVAQPVDFVVTADTKLAGITGVLLEVLPSADEPGFGPGRAGGNFVLGEFSLKEGEYRGN